MGKKEKYSESFIVGVIAVVFLIIGYQTALFIYNASMMKIAANRDEPDTIYVYEHQSMRPSADASGRAALSSHAATPPGAPASVPESSSASQTLRRNSSHTPRAEAVRANLPRKKIETFRFDPNTVTVDELCRLGFSLKQAQSIDSYRRKGGRFRRKTDFAESYVVSDTIYKRLEAYIDIPKTDLNKADSSAFDALPGIGGWFAKKMIEHRNALGGYSYKEQLMDIYRFDEEKFEKLKDLVEVGTDGLTPYPLWSLPADSLRKHPYIGNYETARAIVLYRENSPEEEWTVDKLKAAGILSDDKARKLSGCLLKN